jgi:putative toxin-antitoxin system antitoxin component (TIGR02293 family)
MSVEAAQSSPLHHLSIPPDALNDEMTFIRTVRSGIPGQVVKEAVELLGNRELFVKLLHTSSANLNRYYRRKALDTVDSEEVLDTLRVYFEACRIWGDPDTAREWLHAPVPALVGERPVDLFDTFEGRQWVRQVLRKIEHGEFS